MKHILKKNITARDLKLFAAVGMVLDTIAVVLLQPYHVIPVYGKLWGKVLYYIFRLIGSSSIPLFLFLMAEGFHYTHRRSSYFLRILLFALVSEFPFDMCFYHSVWYTGAQNGLMSAVVAFASVWCVSRILPVGDELGRCESHMPGSKPPEPWLKNIAFPVRVCVCVLITAAACAVTYFCRMAYGIVVPALTAAYFLRSKNRKFAMVSIIVSIDLYLLLLAAVETVSFLQNRLWMGFFGIIAILPVIMYNEVLGKKPGKYTYYCLYAGHMLLLGYIYGFIYVAR